jgi:hypothetical protein
MEEEFALFGNPCIFFLGVDFENSSQTLELVTGLTLELFF